MLRLWMLLIASLHLVFSSCPSGYSLQYDGICTNLKSSSLSSNYADLKTSAVNMCNPNGTPVLIRSQEEQDYWASTVKKYSYPMALGLRCNTTTSTWEWVDGSRVAYKPPQFDSSLTGTCTTAPSWYMLSSGGWYQSASTSSTSNFIIFCMNPLPPIAPADEECGDFDDDSVDNVCYQAGVHAETFADAQQICKSFGANVASIHSEQENSYIRRFAASRALVNGIMLGAYKNDTDWGWIDGTAWDFTKFIPGFPVDGAGDCVAMVTNNKDGQWVNVECDNKASYICARKPGDEEPGCGAAMRTEGEIIYSPGFPNSASESCDFFLKVDADRQVEVEILFLEANSCCDRLILTEGSIGGTVIANLTGEASGALYKTKSSNIMRASWQPNGGINVKGMMITFRGV